MIAEARTPEQWAQMYVSCGLPGTHSTTPGFVILPLSDEVTAVNTPGEIGDRVVALMPERHLYGPVLARPNPARYTFLTHYDRVTEPDMVETLLRYGVDTGPYRANVILPTGLGPITREERYWLCSPRPDEPLPPLTMLLEVVAACLEAPAAPDPRD